MSPWSRVVLSILALLGLASAAAGEECGPFEDDQRTSYRQITWDDFQAPRPDRGSTFPSLVAQISTSVGVENLEVELTEQAGEWLARPRSVCVRAYMHKDRSGQIREYRVREVLDHEQGHFDIAQLCAYELRASIDRLEAHAASPAAAESLLRSRLRDLYRSVVAGCVEAHARYERETSYGNRRSGQQRWRRDLAARLLRIATDRGLTVAHH